MRHDVFQHVTETFLAASHHSLGHYSHLTELQKYLESHPKISCHPNVGEWLDDATGLVKKTFVFVERGQAVCFIPNGKLQDKGHKGNASGARRIEESQPILHLAKCDTWILSIEAGRQIRGREGGVNLWGR